MCKLNIISLMACNKGLKKTYYLLTIILNKNHNFD